MARKNAHTPEEIVAKLRQAEVVVGQGEDGDPSGTCDRGNGADPIIADARSSAV